MGIAVSRAVLPEGDEVFLLGMWVRIAMTINMEAR